jgi:hypothetical protein
MEAQRFVGIERKGIPPISGGDHLKAKRSGKIFLLGGATPPLLGTILSYFMYRFLDTPGGCKIYFLK